MLIDLLVFRAAMMRRVPDQSFSARPRDFIPLATPDAGAEPIRCPRESGSTNR